MVNYNMIIEALLFSSPSPLKQSLIDRVFPNESINLKDRISELNNQYFDEGHAFEICKISGGYQIVSKQEYEHYISLLFEKKNEYTLSRPALDTLAIIAYRQPISKNGIESIRGVDTGGVLKKLITNSLVEIKGRSSSPGRPLLYKTSDQFLDFFGLYDLSGLPKLKEIKQLIETEHPFKKQMAVFDNSNNEID
jgi:segregation and condensation protein B